MILIATRSSPKLKKQKEKERVKKTKKFWIFLIELFGFSSEPKWKISEMVDSSRIQTSGLKNKTQE